MQETTPTAQPVITEKVLQQVQELQDNYDIVGISEVFEKYKDFYAIYSKENEDDRKGMIETINFVGDLCRSIIYAPIITEAEA